MSTVSVEKRQVVPTLSAKATVEQAAPFVLTTSAQGAYRPTVKVNDVVQAGQVLGWNNGVAIKSPAAAVVRKMAEASENLPQYYPVFELEYQGFAVAIEAPALLAVAPIESLAGKFQIQGGLGPTEIMAIVAAPRNQGAEGEDTAAGGARYSKESGMQNAGFSSAGAVLSTNAANLNNAAQAEQDGAVQGQPFEAGPELESRPRVASQTLLCLIDKAEPVRPGQVATVVLTGQAKAGVVAAPVSAVAGRAGKGTVTLVQGERTSLAEVGLGVSDGAYIEITSGLSEGDVISAVAPYLDPRKE
ncbi:hypothetical protein [Arcanobacterium hippocoleae]|uniref:hypothetical protein n=1 Tax=Arcanobacterium hippocoleae TaxID=149017 RepID=UPI00333F8825